MEGVGAKLAPKEWMGFLYMRKMENGISDEKNNAREDGE